MQNNNEQQQDYYGYPSYEAYYHAYMQHYYAQQQPPAPQQQQVDDEQQQQQLAAYYAAYAQQQKKTPQKPSSNTKQQQQDVAITTPTTTTPAASNNNKIELFGNKQMNLPPQLLQAIQTMAYFKQDLYALKTYHEVLVQVEKFVDSIDPYNSGAPSKAFCLLYKLYTLKLTRKQVEGMLVHKNVYCSVVALLYVRFAVVPTEMWSFFAKSMNDSRTLICKTNEKVTVAEFVANIVSDQKYLGILFPRLPELQRREMEKEVAKFVQLPQKKNSATKAYFDKKRKRNSDDEDEKDASDNEQHANKRTKLEEVPIEQEQQEQQQQEEDADDKGAPSDVNERFGGDKIAQTPEQLQKLRSSYLQSANASAYKALSKANNEETIKLGRKAWK